MKGTKSFLVLIGAIVLVLAIVLIIPRFYSPDPVQDTYKYNFFTFEKIEGIWTTQTQEGNNLLRISLRNGPRALEDIPVTGDLTVFRNNFDFFYITFDPTPDVHNSFVTLSNAEISPNFVRHFGKDVLPACTIENQECIDSGVSIITCDNTQEGVVYLNSGAETSVVINGNCAIISGTDEELVKAADRFMYGMYGIMK